MDLCHQFRVKERATEAPLSPKQTIMLNKVRRVQRLGGPDATSPTLEDDQEVKIEQTNGDLDVMEFRANRTP